MSVTRYYLMKTLCGLEPSLNGERVKAKDCNSLLRSHKNLLDTAKRYDAALAERSTFTEAIKKAEEFHK